MKFRRERLQSHRWGRASKYRREMRKYLVIFGEAVSHIWLCNRSRLNFLLDEENLISFCISAQYPPFTVNLIIWCPSRHSFKFIFFLLLQYSILQDSSSLNFLRWGDSSCAEQIICDGLPAEVFWGRGAGRGNRTRDCRTAVQRATVNLCFSYLDLCPPNLMCAEEAAAEAGHPGVSCAQGAQR